MKKLKKLSLQNLSQAEMRKKELGMIRGGGEHYCACVCSDKDCPCKYAGTQEGTDDSYYGGSSTSDNNKANAGDAPQDSVFESPFFG